MTDDELIQVYHDAQHKAIQHADATIEDAHLAGLRSVLERHEYVPSGLTIVLDAPPPDGRFIEAEDGHGNSIKVPLRISRERST